MMYEIKYIVDKCRIQEAKTKREEALANMFKLDREMALLTLDRTVGMYVNNLNKYEYLLSHLEEEEKTKMSAELAYLYSEIKASEGYPMVIKYRNLLGEYNTLKATLGNYAKSINVELRDELKKLSLPKIYVYQNIDDTPKFKHIISSDIIVPSVTKKRSTVIFPLYNIESNRDFRRFYNRVSFQYLEMLSNDCSYSLKNKKLSKVKIVSNNY